MEQGFLQVKNVEESASFFFNKIYQYANQDQINLGFSGGRSPEPLLMKIVELIKESNLEISKLHIYQVDERYTPYDSDQNNGKMIERAFVKPLNLRESQYHRIPTHLPYEKAITFYQRELGPIRLDLVQLGIGDDGHTASLFKDSDLVRGSNSVIATEAPVAVHERISLSKEKILESRELIFYAPGKGPVIDQISKEIKEKPKLMASYIIKEHQKAWVLW